ncbi:unnamed protein product [Ceratitis capitata]|uniref:(Mediterranean fruit fly) hypothetical protein n=1 Tax=Ceratitis capitata TaxID=7213 RepID=A0A811UHN1_CERCA|nr:unnamed protein product [Ceratitis capitata]
MDPIKDDDEYRKQIRSHFMDNITKGKFQQIPSQQHYPPENTFQSNKMPDFELYKQQYKRANRSSGGDADRMLYDPHFAGHGSQAESYRGSCYNENVNFNRHYPTKPKPPLRYHYQVIRINTNTIQMMLMHIYMKPIRILVELARVLRKAINLKNHRKP